MRVYGNRENLKRMEGVESRMMHEHIALGRLIPPHEKKALMHIEFEDADWDLLQNIFKDEDTAMAAVEIIRDAPPEIQIIVIQLIDLIKEVA